MHIKPGHTGVFVWTAAIPCTCTSPDDHATSERARESARERARQKDRERACAYCYTLRRPSFLFLLPSLGRPPSVQSPISALASLSTLLSTSTQPDLVALPHPPPLITRGFSSPHYRRYQATKDFSRQRSIPRPLPRQIRPQAPSGPSGCPPPHPNS